MIADVKCVIGFEVAIVGLMKVNHDGHDLTHGHPRCPYMGITLMLQSMCLPVRSELLPKIIDMTV